MKNSSLITVAAFTMLTGFSANATQPEPKAAMQSQATPMTDNSAHQQMMERAQNAKTPAEREKLMTENMAMMKADMASMKAKMADGGMMSQGKKPMKMDPADMKKMKAKMAEGGMMAQGKGPMAMDPAHMQKMKQHMGMMYQMMERLMLQQELMMDPEK
ncbi:hypothetical protein [Parasphingorhabdus sp.]|uniref:hypothetical protein n=1 Tax=Parasphingorhabdus sp. TaxID=2709688 RepID=UPI002F9304F2